VSLRSFAFSISVILATGSAGHEATSVSRWPSGVVAASEMDDEDLMFSNNGATPFLRGQTPGADHSYSLRLETDSCGMLKSLSNNRARIAQSALADDFDDDEDDPTLERETLVSRWLSSRPEIAVFGDAIDKWCNDDWFSGEDVPPEFVAEPRGGRPYLRRARPRLTTLLAPSEIA